MNVKFSLTGTLVCLLVVSFSSTASSAPSPADTYQKACAVCHGSKGDGRGRVVGGMTPPPRDFTSQLASIELTRERLIKSISEGRPGTTMVGWKKKLSAEEIAAMADYIRASFIKPTAAGNKVSLPPALAKRVKAGEQIYTENCSVCHGDYGQTGVWTQSNMASAPRNFTSDRAHSELSRKRMIESVAFGIPGKAMMPFGSRLKPEEIESVVDYIRLSLMQLPVQQVIQEATAPMPNPSAMPTSASQSVGSNAQIGPDFVNSAEYMKRPFPNGMKGDPNEGRKIFVRNCFACHGVNGDGQGPRAFFINPKPRNFISPDSRRALNRPRIFTAVNGGLRGSVMPAWGKVFTQQQVADVAEFVFRAFVLADMRGISQADLSSADQKKN